MLYLRAAIVVFVLGCASAQDSPICANTIFLQVGQVYRAPSPNYPNFYTGTVDCRFLFVAPPRYVVEAQCHLELPNSPGCEGDRVEISTTGNPNDAEWYCGTQDITIYSEQRRLSLALKAINSTGGRFICFISPVQA